MPVWAHCCFPWLVYSLPGAYTFGAETEYTAQQFGTFAKGAYVPLVLCLGETVNPLRLLCVMMGGIGFGVLMFFGLLAARKARDPLLWLCIAQVVACYAAGLVFAAASPKHLIVVLPAWVILLATGAELAWRTKRGFVLIALVIGSHRHDRSRIMQEVTTLPTLTWSLPGAR